MYLDQRFIIVTFLGCVLVVSLLFLSSAHTKLYMEFWNIKKIAKWSCDRSVVEQCVHNDPDITNSSEGDRKGYL